MVLRTLEFWVIGLENCAMVGKTVNLMLDHVAHCCKCLILSCVHKVKRGYFALVCQLSWANSGYAPLITIQHGGHEWPSLDIHMTVLTILHFMIQQKRVQVSIVGFQCLICIPAL